MNIELFYEDCEKTLERLEDGSIDLLLQDVPYGVTACEWDIKPNIVKMWQHWERVVKDDGVLIFTATNPLASELIMSRQGLYKHEIIWDKINGANFMNLKNAPFKVHELVLVFSKVAKFTYNPQKEFRSKKSLKRDPVGGKGRKMKKESHKKNKIDHYNVERVDEFLDNSGLKHPTSIQKFGRFENEYKRYGSGFTHPTSKPLSLFRYLIKTYSNKGETVFDGYSGSGTTAIGCIKENRNFIGAELNKEYYDKAQKRINAALAQPSLFTV